MSVAVQVFGLEHPDDALAAVSIGIDHLGFSIGDPRLPQYIPLEQGQRVFSLLPPGAKTVALFATPDPQLVCQVAGALGPRLVQFCWPVDALGPEAEAQLRAALFPVQVIKEIPVGAAGTRAMSVRAAECYASSADYLILDTAPDDLPWIGATGMTHDWTISRDIVRASPIPCILAGGLGPDNVLEAIRIVGPWGVDSYSRTTGPDGRKDLAKMRAFYEAAKGFDAGR